MMCRHKVGTTTAPPLYYGKQHTDLQIARKFFKLRINLETTYSQLANTEGYFEDVQFFLNVNSLHHWGKMRKSVGHCNF